MSCPIYHTVCEDLKIYPQAAPRNTHVTHMRRVRQEEWVQQAIARSYGGPVPIRSRRSARKRGR